MRKANVKDLYMISFFYSKSNVISLFFLLSFFLSFCHSVTYI